MRSLRARLAVGVVLGTAAVLAAAGGVVYALVREGFVAQLDASLVEKARLFASVVEQKRGCVDLEFDELDLGAFARPGGPGYLWLRRVGGGVLYRSPSLAGADLPAAPADSGVPTCRWVSLPGGGQGRAVGMVFTPRREEDDERPPGASSAAAVRVKMVLAWDAAAVRGQLGTLRNVLLAVGVAAVAVSAALLWVVVRGGLAPLGRLAERISALDETRLAERVPVGSAPAEVRPVVARLNGLLERLEGAFARERGFSADVAHELRTPLAGLRTTLEVAASRPRGPEECAETLADCRRIVQQMQGMVERLLTLARLEAGREELDPEPVDVSAVAREAWAPLAELAERRGLRVRWAVAPCPAVRADRRLLAMVVGNLLDNAVSHADEGGSVAIEVRPDGEAVVFAATNTGCTLTPGQVSEAFERLWRGDEARSGDGHCGLGLSLARRGTEAMGGRIEATVEEGRFGVTVRLGRGDGAAAG